MACIQEHREHGVTLRYKTTLPSLFYMVKLDLKTAEALHLSMLYILQDLSTDAQWSDLWVELEKLLNSAESRIREIFKVESKVIYERFHFSCVDYVAKKKAERTIHLAKQRDERVRLLGIANEEWKKNQRDELRKEITQEIRAEMGLQRHEEDVQILNELENGNDFRGANVWIPKRRRTETGESLDNTLPPQCTLCRLKDEKIFTLENRIKEFCVVKRADDEKIFILEKTVNELTGANSRLKRAADEFKVRVAQFQKMFTF